MKRKNEKYDKCPKCGKKLFKGQVRNMGGSGKYKERDEVQYCRTRDCYTIIDRGVVY